MINTNALFLAFAISAFVLTSYFLTGQLIRYAHKKQLLDVANHRSSHTLATPRIGGLSFVSLIILLVAAYSGSLALDDAKRLLCFTLLPSFIVTVTGLWDDIKGLSQRIRFLLYVVSSVIALGNLTLLATLPLPLAIGTGLIAVLTVSWLINLFNFMDGIDGIASSQAIFLLLALAWFYHLGNATTLTPILLLSAAAIAGFLIANWQPARIFMGDTGSTFLGCFIGCLIFYAIDKNYLHIPAALIITAGFWVDATWTLGYRIISGQRWYQAHRSHSYQILARKLGSHQAVTLGLTSINILWLLPLAWAANQQPSYALLITTISLLPLVALCLIIGAGKSSSN